MVGLIGGTVAVVQVVVKKAHTMVMEETLYVLQLLSYGVDDTPHLKSRGVISKSDDN